jgi:hypothetical protein
MRTEAHVDPSLLRLQWLTLRWTRDTRYRGVHMKQDLWHEWVITQVNGRRGSRFGHAPTHPQSSLAAVLLGGRLDPSSCHRRTP